MVTPAYAILSVVEVCLVKVPVRHATVEAETEIVNVNVSSMT